MIYFIEKAELYEAEFGRPSQIGDCLDKTCGMTGLESYSFVAHSIEPDKLAIEGLISNQIAKEANE